MHEPVTKPRCITFDCYGTLVRWHDALHEAVSAILAEHSEAPRIGDAYAAELVDQLRRISMEQQQGPYRDYQSILRSSLATVMASRGMSPRSSDGDLLLSYLHAIPPHADVPQVLDQLGSRFRLAIISNTDDDLIAGTVAAIGVPIDFVVTAQQAKAYKPDHRLFYHAHTVIGVPPEQTVHVGMGQFTDLKICRELGIRVIWVDRLGEPLNPDWTPDATLPNLSALPDLLAG